MKNTGKEGGNNSNDLTIKNLYSNNNIFMVHNKT